jgi:hypothetical protein
LLRVLNNETWPATDLVDHGMLVPTSQPDGIIVEGSP